MLERWVRSRALSLQMNQEAFDETALDHRGSSEEWLMNGRDRLKVKCEVVFIFILKYPTVQNFGVCKIFFKSLTV